MLTPAPTLSLTPSLSLTLTLALMLSLPLALTWMLRLTRRPSSSTGTVGKTNGNGNTNAHANSTASAYTIAHAIANASIIANAYDARKRTRPPTLAPMPTFALPIALTSTSTPTQSLLVALNITPTLTQRPSPFAGHTGAQDSGMGSDERRRPGIGHVATASPLCPFVDGGSGGGRGWRGLQRLPTNRSGFRTWAGGFFFFSSLLRFSFFFLLSSVFGFFLFVFCWLVCFRLLTHYLTRQRATTPRCLYWYIASARVPGSSGPPRRGPPQKASSPSWRVTGRISVTARVFLFSKATHTPADETRMHPLLPNVVCNTRTRARALKYMYPSVALDACFRRAALPCIVWSAAVDALPPALLFCERCITLAVDMKSTN